MGICLCPAGGANIAKNPYTATWQTPSECGQPDSSNEIWNFGHAAYNAITKIRAVRCAHGQV